LELGLRPGESGSAPARLGIVCFQTAQTPPCCRPTTSRSRPPAAPGARTVTCVSLRTAPPRTSGYSSPVISLGRGDRVPRAGGGRRPGRVGRRP